MQFKAKEPKFSKACVFSLLVFLGEEGNSLDALVVVSRSEPSRRASGAARCRWRWRCAAGCAESSLAMAGVDGRGGGGKKDDEGGGGHRIPELQWIFNRTRLVENDDFPTHLPKNWISYYTVGLKVGDGGGGGEVKELC